jgi:hypothetical protein
MFDLTLMKYFLDSEVFTDQDMQVFNANGGSLVDSVREAWYVFCYKLLPSVNKKWRKQMHEDNLWQRPSIFGIITTSDFVLVQWILYCKMEKFLKLKDKQDKPKGKGGRTKGDNTGPHDSKHKMHIYARLYNQFDPLLDNETYLTKWNNIFWDKMEEHHRQKVFRDGEVKRNKRKVEDILASFNIPAYDRPPRKFSSSAIVSSGDADQSSTAFLTATAFSAPIASSAPVVDDPSRSAFLSAIASPAPGSIATPATSLPLPITQGTDTTI